MSLKRRDYFYDLPESLIAQHPLRERDSSRMLVYSRKDGECLTDKHFFDLPDFLRAGDLLVVNNTKVLPARLFGNKESGARIEVLLHRRIDLKTWEVVCRPAKRLRIGDRVVFSDDLSAVIQDNLGEGLMLVAFDFVGVFEEILIKVGEMPLPHYIHEKLEDGERYQTVYAKNDGSAAAPTAGLHFTPALLSKLEDMGVQITKVTLHVGLGTFRPVKADDITGHKMHSEYFEVTKEAAEAINRAKSEGRRVIAVGTTSVRVLESAANLGEKLQELRTMTDIFIYPGYKFKVIDGLITNFHLPESTLIMLVSAFLGREKTLELYNLAVKEKFRFFSFGDAMLLL